MTNRERQIIEILRQSPLISQKELADTLGIKRSSVAVHITNLVKKGHIKGKGYILQEDDYAVVIGGANMDITGFTQHNLIDRDSNPGRITMTPGGVARNIAHNLVNLGINTKLVTAIGNDVFGNQLLDSCTQCGIDTSLIKKIENHSSSIYLSIIENSGDMKLAISDMGITERLTKEMLASHHHIIDNASCIIADTNLEKGLLEYLATTFKDRVILDTVSTAKTEKIIDFVGSFKMIKPNRQEAELLVGFSIKTKKQAEKAIEILLDKGVQTIILTMGEEGVLYGSSRGLASLKLPGSSAVNTTGAGDAFLAALVYGQLRGYSLNESVKIASTASLLTMKSEFSSDPSLCEDILINTYQTIS